MESLKGEPMLWKFALYFNHCVLQENSITENISMDISHPHSIKNIIIFDVSNGVNVRFLHRIF